MYRWYNSSPSTVVLDQLEEVVAGCHRDSRMVPLALVNLVSMLHSRCRIELHGLIEIDDEPASVLGSQLRSVQVYVPLYRFACPASRLCLLLRTTIGAHCSSGRYWHITGVLGLS